MANYYWIKLYYDLLDDRKVGQLPDSLKWRFIECLLMAGEIQEKGVLPPVEDMAWRLGRMQPEALTNDLSHLSRAGLLELTPTSDGERWLVTNFEKRQTAKSNAERQAAWRGRRAEITNPLQSNNDSVTNRYLDTDTDTDTDTEEDKKKPTRKPKQKPKKELVFDFPSSLDTESFRQMFEIEWVAARKEQKKPLTARAANLQLKELAKYPVAVAEAMVKQSIMNQWQGIFPLKDGISSNGQGNGRQPSRPIPESEETRVGGVY